MLEASVVGGHMIGRVFGIGGEFEVFGWLVGWRLVMGVCWTVGTVVFVALRAALEL